MDTKSDTQVLPVLPLRDIVVFPHMIVPLFVGREKSVKALEDVMNEDKQILLLTQKSASDDDPNKDDIYKIGTISTVLQLLKLPDGTVKVLVEGGKRACVTQYVEHPDFFQAECEVLVDETEEAEEVEERTKSWPPTPLSRRKRKSMRQRHFFSRLILMAVQPLSQPLLLSLWALCLFLVCLGQAP